MRLMASDQRALVLVSWEQGLAVVQEGGRRQSLSRRRSLASLLQRICPTRSHVPRRQLPFLAMRAMTPSYTYTYTAGPDQGQAQVRPHGAALEHAPPLAMQGRAWLESMPRREASASVLGVRQVR